MSDDRPASTEEPASAAADDAAGRQQPGRRLNTAVVIGVFLLGVLFGLPASMFGMQMLVQNAVTIFGVMVALVLFAGIITALAFAFRRPILGRIVGRAEVEMDRFAGPLADVARYAAQQKVEEATESARNLAELVLARYAWISTRRWLVATITGLIAAMAALAGSALLFQQNELLKKQSLLMQEQTERLSDQNSLIGQQIDLAEAQRSTSIVPEIIEIASRLGDETSALQKSTGKLYFTDTNLSRDLVNRIVAATLAIRPYRYLVAANPLESDFEVQAGAMQRRPELGSLGDYVSQRLKIYADIGVTRGGLKDRPVSPERGQLLTNLYVAGILGTENLSYQGADFSFAEVRTEAMHLISLQYGRLRYADFSRVNLNEAKFGAADLSESRFRLSFLNGCDFSSIEDQDVKPPYSPDEEIGRRFTYLTGADFRGAILSEVRAVNARALGADFDYTLVHNSSFAGTDLSAATFRNAVLDDVDFTGASLKSVDFDGAYVFDQSFLAKLEQQAQKDSFVADRYQLVPGSMEDISVLPAYDYSWLIEGIDDPDLKVWRVKRVGDFQ